MSPIATMAVVLVSLWMAVLTVAIALLMRQVAILTHYLDPDYAPDGLPVGRRIPRAIADLLPNGTGGLLVLGAGCAPCRELAVNLRGASFAAPLVVLIEGDANLAAAIASELPAEARILAGEEARDPYSSLALQTTPFLFLVEGREIVKKTTPQSAGHLLSMLEKTHSEPVSRQQARSLELSNVS